MIKRLNKVLMAATLCIALFGAAVLPGTNAVAGDAVAREAIPQVTAGVPFFYYDDLEEAKAFYGDKLGFPMLADRGWVAIFALTPTSYVGLVNADGGTLSPIDDKGVLLSIETEELEAWWDKLKDVEGINMIHGIEIGAHDMIEEFRMTDPGGYIVEFYRWVPEHSPYPAQ